MHIKKIEILGGTSKNKDGKNFACWKVYLDARSCMMSIVKKYNNLLNVIGIIQI